MREETTYLTASDDTPLFVRTWLPREPARPRAVVHLVHGMAEHSARYARFAQALTDAGYAVVADDHRGHGRTIGAASPQGHTHDEDGWTAVLADLDVVRDHIDATFPGVPVILLGHSWGSLLVRGWVARHGQEVAPGATRYPLAGLVIMGTASDPGLIGTVGLALAKVQARVRGASRPSALLNRLSFATSTKGIEPLRTESDWLSRDAAEVDAYIADPWCGFTCSAGFFRDLTTAAIVVNRDDAFGAVPADLPVLVVSGEADPVGAWGEGVRKVAARLDRAGVRDLTVQLYPGARHELLNETNRDEVTADLLAWISQRLH